MIIVTYVAIASYIQNHLVQSALGCRLGCKQGEKRYSYILISSNSVHDQFINIQRKFSIIKSVHVASSYIMLQVRVQLYSYPNDCANCSQVSSYANEIFKLKEYLILLSTYVNTGVPMGDTERLVYYGKPFATVHGSKSCKMQQILHHTLLC